MATRFIFAVLCALILAACATGDTQPPPQVPTAATDWNRSWLRSEPCAPPCFLNIMPGTSSQTTTLELMRAAYPAVEQVETHSNDSNPSLKSWRWNEQRPAGSIGAYFYEVPPRFNTAPVDTIVSLLVVSPNMAALSEAIAAFGEPSHVMAVAHKHAQSDVFYYLSVVYFDRGLMLTFDTGSRRNRRVGIAPELIVREVVFFSPTLDGFDAGVSAFYPLRHPSALLVPWQGFQPFAAYCRSSQPDAQSERCP
jgi:hypothetical protein